MLSAAQNLEDDQVAQAGRAETAAVEKLDELYMALTDYPQLLERAIEEQQTLVDRVTIAVDSPEKQPQLDTPDVAWRQRFVEDWARMLVVKAKALQERRKPLRQSMENAVQLAPRVANLTAAAAEQLDNNQPGEALPQQEEALRLLREIAKPLREQRQQEQQNKDNQEQQERQQQQEQQKKDRNQEQEKKQDEQQQRHGNQQQERLQRQPMSEEQLQALIENVRERKRKRDEELKRIRAAVARPAGVDKDW
jgi:hypothetical protein